MAKNRKWWSVKVLQFSISDEGGWVVKILDDDNFRNHFMQIIIQDYSPTILQDTYKLG